MKNRNLTTAIAVVTTLSFVCNLFSVAAFVLAPNDVRIRLRSASDDVFGGLRDLVNALVAMAIARSERQAASLQLVTDRGHLPPLCTISAASEGHQ